MAQTKAETDTQSHTWHGSLITGPMSLHEAGQPTQLLLQLHDGVQVAGGDGGLRAIPWQQPQHVVWPRAAGHRLQRVGGITDLGVEGALFSRQLLLVLHKSVVRLLNLVMLEVGEALGMLRLACMLGLPVNPLRQWPREMAM